MNIEVRDQHSSGEDRRVINFNSELGEIAANGDILHKEHLVHWAHGAIALGGQIVPAKQLS